VRCYATAYPKNEIPFETGHKYHYANNLDRHDRKNQVKHRNSLKLLDDLGVGLLREKPILGCQPSKFESYVLLLACFYVQVLDLTYALVT
jgi:hypothetical protein